MQSEIQTYIKDDQNISPLFLCGDSLLVLKAFPDTSIDCIITSPPYFQKRSYKKEGIGQEKSLEDYLEHLLAVFKEVKRILKPAGSFWLNLADGYKDKGLQLIPWKIAIALQQEGWIIRNVVIWDKVKGAMSSAKDRLSNQYEPIFHLVKEKNYYYNEEALKSKPREVQIKKGKVISATGVSGISYKRKIEMSPLLTSRQKEEAQKALEKVLESLQKGEIADFRMIIKGINRPMHGDDGKLSGRARELEEKGFYFIFYDPKGARLSDLWSILPEDKHNRSMHFAPFPLDLARNPIALSCPEGGIVLDPFSGTGTTCLAAFEMGRKSIGIELVKDYIDQAKERLFQAYF